MGPWCSKEDINKKKACRCHQYYTRMGYSGIIVREVQDENWEKVGFKWRKDILAQLMWQRWVRSVYRIKSETIRTLGW